jgi:hypothetical protein
LICVRSRRPLAALGAGALMLAVLFGLLAYEGGHLPAGWGAVVALGAGSLSAGGVALWAAWQLTTWPPGKLAFFRDRLVVVQGRHEMRAQWEHMDSVTLADGRAWPRVRMTDWLTINLRNEPAIALKPARFGLEAAACRDLILNLRDKAALRERLPEFDSARDLSAAPVVAGELFELRL